MEQAQASSGPPLAKITDRFLAYLADILPFLTGYYGSLYYLLFVRHDPSGWKRVLLAWAFAYFVYEVVGNFLGATVGKRLLGLKVVRPDGEGLGLGRSVVRALGYFAGMPLFNLGFLWALFHPESRAWHDLLARSLVVEAEAKTQAQTARNALLAFAAIAGVVLVNFRLFVFAPTPADREAVRKARAGLQVLAQIEETCKAERGAYTDQLGDLARASGDVRQFREAMGAIFDPDGFVLSAGKDSYEIKARALDRRRSEVSIKK